MAEKRRLIVAEELARKINENRGDMSRSEFLKFLIDSQLKEEATGQNKADYVTKEEFYEFAQGMRELLRNSLEFFVSYGLEMSKQPKDKAFEELSEKLQALRSTDSKGTKA